MHVVVPGKEHILCICLSVLLAGFGFWELWRSWGIEKPTDVDVAQLERGAQVPAVWLRIHGQALWGERAEEQQDGRSRFVVPVISGKQGSRQHVAVFLDYWNASAEPRGDPGLTAFEGTVSDAYLRSTKEDFHRRGLHEAEQFVVLSPGETPRDVIKRSYLFFAMSGGLLALAALLVWLRRLGILPRI